MIRSVGAGSTGLSNQTRRKTQTSPFPKIGNEAVSSNEKAVEGAVQGKTPMMVGVKMKAELKSIFDEENGVVKLNADGDRLEVSKQAITMANETLF